MQILHPQFRTKLQHIWATAVEMMGIYTKSNLKSSQGNENILSFFTLVSSVFAKMENMPIYSNTNDDYNILIDEIRDIDKKLNLISQISALSVAINHTNASKTMKGKGYYVLILNYKDKLLMVRGFSSTQIELAMKVYNQIEATNNPDIDAVLVSAISFDTLKAAYPNYFTDISQFVDTMRKILA